MRIVWSFLAGVGIAVLVGLFFLVIHPVWRDDARFEDFHKRVLAYPLPPDTRSKSASEATFGKLPDESGGTRCEYRVRLILQTDLSQAEISEYYRRAVVAGADGDDTEISLRSEEAGGGAIVQFYDTSLSDWDWRCT
ncbi:hypothetical protein AB0C18_25595 [Nonomuraea muscovyensis]|uniref:hypothetical protein n=1 Tax=Nonomuraea muscovyensis TaxID=1124761 RepID=UPI0033E4F3AA